MLSAEKRDNKEVFSQKEKDWIIKKIFWERQIDSAFLYKWNWWDAYGKILESGKYRAHQAELKIIDKHKLELQKYIKKYITDIWCGDAEKAIHLLKDIESIYNLFYVASDYSASMTEIAENNIKTEMPNINIWNHQIMRPWNELFTNNLDDNTYLWTWCTIWNFYRQGALSQLKNMNNSWMLKWNNIIFSYFQYY